MSNVLFLIGNGFDLNCGLKSRYIDAYNYYCSKTSNNSEVIKKFKKELGIYDKWVRNFFTYSTYKCWVLINTVNHGARYQE